mmetsp:Transcript_37536/g.121563  ORF Transcript_37536/g.121563 Transcript_37536/m.121563 type:complete len:219 (+) Transcript_37536:1146-1802(+)
MPTGETAASEVSHAFHGRDPSSSGLSRSSLRTLAGLISPSSSPRDRSPGTGERAAGSRQPASESATSSPDEEWRRGAGQVGRALRGEEEAGRGATAGSGWLRRCAGATAAPPWAAPPPASVKRRETRRSPAVTSATGWGVDEAASRKRYAAAMCSPAAISLSVSSSKARKSVWMRSSRRKEECAEPIPPTGAANEPRDCRRSSAAFSSDERRAKGRRA